MEQPSHGDAPRIHVPMIDARQWSIVGDLILGGIQWVYDNCTPTFQQAPPPPPPVNTTKLKEVVATPVMPPVMPSCPLIAPEDLQLALMTSQKAQLAFLVLAEEVEKVRPKVTKKPRKKNPGA